VAHFPKPAEGSWTEHWAELSTAPVDYTDSVDPAYYELERDAIFRKTWLMVGRVEQVPHMGSYYTSTSSPTSCCCSGHPAGT
jgi:phenylpropionate dioxygenase-like ring-hydroxylating dioxygenase large terminal subunit